MKAIGTRCAAQTWYIGAVPDMDWILIAGFPNAASTAAAAASTNGSVRSLQ